MDVLVWHHGAVRHAPEGRDLPPEDCLDVLRQVSAVSYRRNDLSESTRRIGFIAQRVEASLGPSTANTNVVDSIEREVSLGVTETLKTLSYERMSVILWQCTRSLLARLETLEAKLAQQVKDGRHGCDTNSMLYDEKGRI